MRLAAKMTFAALLGLTALGMTATTASARVVCNREGACWHNNAAYNYRPEFGLVVHPDTWRWGNGEHYSWREHEGRGYWHSGKWRTF